MNEKLPLGFWQWAQKAPDRHGLVSPDGKEYSAGELLQLINQLSHGLRSLGLQKGDGIAMMLGNGTEWVALALAASQIGLYYTPINYHLTGEEAAYIVDDCEAKVLIVDAAYSDAARVIAQQASLPQDRRFSVGSVEGYRPFSEIHQGQPTDLPENRLAGQNMNYTSGTTGKPKGVRRPLMPATPEQAAQLGTLLAGLFNIPAGSYDGVHLCAGPLYHTAPGAFSLMGLHLGQSLVLMHRWDPEKTLELIDKFRVTTTHLVPTMFHRMLALPDEVKSRYKFDSLRSVIHAAAPCPPDIKHRMIEWWGPVIYEYYGATEGGGTSVKPKEWLQHPGTVGRAWPGSTIKVLDDEGNECPPNTQGTVYMGSPIGSFEYYKDPKKTNENRRKDLFTVGDIGYLTEDGFLFLCDRKSDMIIAGGVNIYPAEIEAVFLSHPKVADVAVFGVPDNDMGESVYAVIQLSEGSEDLDALKNELNKFAEAKLAKFKLPRGMEFRKELPREPSGKLFKRKLRDEFWKHSGRHI
ncbi:MAG: acyl-CoA synthetase [Chrysiogenetes bacterium]|nr:acyl-CoA synthetase [Chrysiogenetes bacterium]